MGPVYMLTLRQLAGRWRLLIIAAVSALPALITLLTLRSQRAPSLTDFEGTVLNGLLAGSAAPLVMLALAAAAFGNEVEDRTLANLTLAPVPRWKIVLPKLLASITVAAPFIVVSALVTAWLAYMGDVTAILAVTVAMLIGVTLYAAGFLWLGLVSSQAVGAGLLYIVLWEGFLSRYVSGVRLLSIRHYATSLMHQFDARRFPETDVLTLPVVAATCTALFGLFVLLSVRRLRRMDVP